MLISVPVPDSCSLLLVLDGLVLFPKTHGVFGNFHLVVGYAKDLF